MSNDITTRPSAPVQVLNISEFRLSSIHIRGGEQRRSWTRDQEILGATVAVLRIGNTGACGMPAGETAPRPGVDARSLDAKFPDAGSHAAAVYSGRIHRPRPSAALPDAQGGETASTWQPAVPTALSDQEEAACQARDFALCPSIG
jgi:hypothetical protein